MVTANLLKPTPLSSATMRQRCEIVSATVARPAINEATVTSYSNTSSRVVHIENPTAQGVGRTHATRIQQQVIEFPTLSPQNSPSAASISLLGSNSRRDSDHKKDSGLESGEVSDDSRDGRISGNGDETEGYSKLPSYLTTISVNNCSDSRTVSAIDDAGCYDRLPAYITGVGSRANSVEKVVTNSIGEHKSQTVKSESSSVDGSSGIMIEESSGRSAAKGKKSIKLYRRKDAESESSRSRSRSPIGITTRLRGNPKLPVASDSSVKKVSTKRSRQRSRTRSSSSSSSYLSSRSSSAESDDSTPSPIKEAKNRGRKRSWRKSSRRTSRSPEITTSKRKLQASNRSKVPRHRTPSPKRNRSRSGRGGINKNESGFFQRFTRDRQRREQEERHNYQESNRQVEERRVVFVGKIAEGTTRADLRKRFEVFGPIIEISVHFRDNGDNYGFVTFKYKVDAYEAIEHGNDDPTFQTVDICFGGRRTFCKDKYADLDSANLDLDLNPRLNSRHFSQDDDSMSSMKSSESGKRAVSDFDALLQQAKALKAKASDANKRPVQ